MNIYLLKAGQRNGPFTPVQVAELICQRMYSLSDLAWHEGLYEWYPIHTISDVANLVVPPVPKVHRANSDYNDPPDLLTQQPPFIGEPIFKTNNSDSEVITGFISKHIKRLSRFEKSCLLGLCVLLICPFVFYFFASADVKEGIVGIYIIIGIVIILFVLMRGYQYLVGEDTYGQALPIMPHNKSNIFGVFSIILGAILLLISIIMFIAGLYFSVNAPFHVYVTRVYLIAMALAAGGVKLLNCGCNRLKK